jgi:hypothetical protein
MSAKPPISVSPEELKDALAILVSGRHPRHRRIVKAETEDGIVDAEIIALDGPWAVAMLLSGKLTIIGKLARRRRG